jgi:hypothetical protein
MLCVVFFLQCITFVLMLSRMIIYLETIYPKENLKLMMESLCIRPNVKIIVNLYMLIIVIYTL